MKGIFIISLLLFVRVSLIICECSFEDIPIDNPDWQKGRNGKLCVTNDNNEEIRIDLTEKPEKWALHTMETKQQDEKLFVVKFRQYVAVDTNGSKCTPYTMRYEAEENVPEIKTVQINGETCKRKGDESCHFKDTHVINDAWFDGRNGKLCVDIPKSKNFTIKLNRDIQKLRLHSMIVTVISPSVYEVKFHTWATTDSKQITCSDYTMRYLGNYQSGVIESIQFDSLLCSKSDSITNTTEKRNEKITTTITGIKKAITAAKPSIISIAQNSKSNIDPCQNAAKNSCNSYKCALKLSLLFYEAQRSGDLPSDNRVPWRSSSTRMDGIWSKQNVDLTGGYFDAGDYVKFNFPQAAAMTMLGWGLVKYEKGYAKAGELDNGLKALKWGIDYLKKCHTNPTELWGQVGKGDIDHSKWERPEVQYPDTVSSRNKASYIRERPIYKIDKKNPGSDLAGEVAAAFAVSSIVFKNKDKAYSDDLLKRARELYNFAVRYRRKYSDSIADADRFYKSYSGYIDELALASVWLYIATKEIVYLNAAENYWGRMDKYASELSWDNKGRAVAILLAEVTNKNFYKQNVVDFYNTIKSLKTTPYGTKFIQKWGSNRHAANVAFAMLTASDLNINGFKNEQIDFTKGQINSLLGYNNKKQSFLIGYGKNYPKYPHHTSSSCPQTGSCGWSFYSSAKQNTYELKGALVGGPACESGCYVDKRSDYIANEVTLDYNAGFQSALAGLVEKC